MSVDVIIPVYKPDKNFLNLLEEISHQSIPVNKIIVYNIEQKFFDRLMYSSRLSDDYKNMEVHHISKHESDPGKIRNMAVKLSDADYFLMMDQHSMPVSTDLIKLLLNAVNADSATAVAYARQIPMEEASEAEKYAMRYYFPEESAVHALKDVESLGRTAYMNSDNCALYKRAAFNEVGGYLNHVIANQDVLLASRLINADYKVSYVADAIVINTSVSDNEEIEKASFDIAVSYTKHPETFDLAKIKAELKKLDKMILNHLKRNGFRTQVLSYKKMASAARKGYSKGFKFKKIPMYDLHKYSANAEYWRMDEILRDRSSVDVHSGYGRSAAELDMLATPPVVKKQPLENHED